MKRTGPSQAVRDAVFARDRGCCICGANYPLNLHHRRARGAGGTRRPETNSPANLVVLCGSGTEGCHGFVEAHPELARDRGYRVGQHQNPADVPVLRHGVWSYLTDDGAVGVAPS